MTLVALGSLVPYPGGHSHASLVTTTTLLDAAGEYSGLVFRATRAGNISAIGWLPGTVVGGGTVDVRVETVDDTTGLPSGTLWGTNTLLASVAPASSTWRWDTLTAAAAVSIGNLLAVKIIYNSGTSVRVAKWNGPPDVASGVPYNVVNTGTPSKTFGSPFIAVKYDDGVVSFIGAYPSNSSAVITTTVAETATPDEIGMKIVLPMKCTVAGLLFAGGVTAGRVYDIALYDNSDNVKASATGIDSDDAVTVGGVHMFDAPVTLDAGTYRATIIAKSGASTITVSKITVDASSTRGAWPGGTDLQWTERTNAGAWTDTDTAVPIMDLLLSALDDGAGAAGLIVNPGLSGGLL